MRGFVHRILVGILGTVALGAVLACPPRPPAPVGPPDASDAAPAPRPVTCDTGCTRAVIVCSTVDRSTCLDLCGRIGGAFPDKLATATTCADVKATDPGAPSVQP